MREPAGADQFDDDRAAADFIAGTGRGLEAVYRAYGRSLYSVARSVLGADDDAADCVHDTLLRVWQGARTYRAERGTLRAYLLVAVRNDALTRKRTGARHARIEERAARGEDRHYEIEMTDSNERARLRRALATLPPDQKTALELAYFGELTHVQVAQYLKAPLGTVKSRIAMALRKLHAALRDGSGHAS